jgi:hypothetical protein
MPALRIDGYVIVSADGMLANAERVMPAGLKFEGDQRFFSSALGRADLIVHGRRSFEDQPNSALRNRIILTRAVASIATDYRRTGGVRDVSRPLRHVLAVAGASPAPAGR